MPKAEKRACCYVSELLEEAGIDREKTRALKKQVLEGLILLCQWQLTRMQTQSPAPRKRGRKVAVD